jgi:hypothetical protein
MKHFRRRSDGARVVWRHDIDGDRVITLAYLAEARGWEEYALEQQGGDLPRNGAYCMNCDFHVIEHVNGHCLLSLETFSGYKTDDTTYAGLSPQR